MHGSIVCRVLMWHSRTPLGCQDMDAIPIAAGSTPDGCTRVSLNPWLLAHQRAFYVTAWPRTPCSTLQGPQVCCCTNSEPICHTTA